MNSSLHREDVMCLQLEAVCIRWLMYADLVLEKDPKFNAQLGALLRAARVRAEMSLADVAKQVGCAKSAIGNWETGVNAISVVDLLKLAGLYRIPPEQLLPGSTAPLSAEEQFLRDYAGLDEAGKTAMRAFQQTYAAAAGAAASAPRLDKKRS